MATNIKEMDGSNVTVEKETDHPTPGMAGVIIITTGLKKISTTAIVVKIGRQVDPEKNIEAVEEDMTAVKTIVTIAITIEETTLAEIEAATITGAATTETNIIITTTAALIVETSTSLDPTIM